MKAYWFEKAGEAADVLQSGEMPQAEPGPDEVTVRMICSAVNPTDVKRRETGRELGRFDRIIPNNDGSGIIEAVGVNVDPARIGGRVWIFGAQAMRPHGTAAEYCTLPARLARPLSDNQSFADGACLGVPAVTASHGIFADGPMEGKTILITGGSGRVGRYAVQMAHLAGATVIATAGTAEKVAEIKDLGADHALNYKSDNIVHAVKEVTSGKGVDRILDVAFGANIMDAPELVRDNGVIASYSSDGMPRPEIPFTALMYKNVLIRPFAIFGLQQKAQAAAFAHVEGLLNESRLRHKVGHEFAFDEMIAANEAIAKGDAGGVCLVRIADE
ncbi:MAG: NADPH:quinone reductase [Alphaproteobacteria bacterium]|nr:MAG: NADPH:quinone reductase [Alphaproteobacteria bacterium]